MNIRYLVPVIAFALTVFPFFATAQDAVAPAKKWHLRQDLQAGMIAGGQVSNTEFVYKSGFMGQYSLNREVGRYFSTGLGIGFQKMDTETIVPLFLDFKARFRDEPRTSFLAVNIGSTSGWSTYYRQFDDYQYSGGFYFSANYGYRFPVKDQLAFLFTLGYIHQEGWIEYNTFNDQTYQETFAFDFLTLKAGFSF